MPEFLAVGLHEESKESEWTHPLWVITESLKSLSIGFAGIAVVLVGGAFVAFGWFMLFRKNRRAAVMMVLPAFMAGGTMLLLGHNLWPVFFFNGIWVIDSNTRCTGVAEADHKFCTSSSTKFCSCVCCWYWLGGLIDLSVRGDSSENLCTAKTKLFGAKNYVELHSSPSDERVAVSLAGIVYGKYLTPYWFVAATGRDLEILQENGNRVWLIYTIPTELKTFRPDIWRVIQHHFEVTQVFSRNAEWRRRFCMPEKRDFGGVALERHQRGKRRFWPN